MVISELCIRRPVFATVLSLLVLLVGLMSYSRLTVRDARSSAIPANRIAKGLGPSSQQTSASSSAP